ncbi:Alpha-acetolactate decarboxylase [Hyphodiscus hymeniophilus]|uniref:Alpha-acetolactate decarboxylase n=1 Tax=Hyphodiscus hymeniophilus TaxID=353542 RepID=A0A9P6VQ02_9HELO|nr:Alpha-acetolactate decarboxylase [Hyphodiscus hymeniophilus]
MANQLYQYSIINALMDGVASGGIELSNLQELGDHGLGTFESIDGEMVMIDSISYHLRADGSIETATAHNKLPFAMVTNFTPTISGRKVSLPDKDAIYKTAKEMFPSTSNVYLALKIDGTFQRMKVRAVRGQRYKGQPLSELGDSQAVNEYTNIEGTVFGFRSPPFSQGISVAGGHLHFVSAKRDCGGHVLELEASGAEISGAVIKDVRIELPESVEFNEAKLEKDAGGIGKIEG